jgi:hypothetical protein
MRIADLCVVLLFPLLAYAQTPERKGGPDLGLILCWNDDAEVRLARDKLILTAAGRAIGLGGTIRTVGVRSEACATHMPDAACLGVPGGIMCQAAVIEREIRAAAWAVGNYHRDADPPYERFRRTNPEAVGYAFQYADGARPDSEADRLRASLAPDGGGSEPLVAALVDYSLAALLGHELAHTNESLPCAVARKSSVEDTGLWQKLIRNELGGEIFARHNADPNEVGADRCGLRHLLLLNDRIEDRLKGQSADATDFIRRFASDMLAFQICFGWRRFTQLPSGRYAVFSQDQYLYSPYRATLFAVEARGSASKPAICGYAAEIIVQAIQSTYTKLPGRGNVDDDFLALFPKGVETSWNGAPWTPESFSCAAPKSSPR